VEKFECYGVLLDAIEEYIENIQYKKAYWNSDEEKEEFQKMDAKWQTMKKLARIDYESFKKNFSYDARNDEQKQTLDSWYGGYQK
jgi:hypothetical protein